MSGQQTETVWAKGDHCLSPCASESGLFRATICKLERTSTGQVLAVVKFDGYGDEDKETVDIAMLQKVEHTKENKKVTASSTPSRRSIDVKPGFFTPFQGDEMDSRLRDKYGSLDMEDLDQKPGLVESVLVDPVKKRRQVTSSSGSSSRKTTPLSQSRKGVVAFGGKAVEKCRGGKHASTTVTKEAAVDHVPSTDVKSHKTMCKNDVHSNSNSTTDWSSQDTYDSVEGFEESDMEKPKFRFTPVAAKVPYILSENDQVPLVQVPAVINQYLRDYQREGIKFMYSHYKHNRGALLADDMGLGKTVQVIGFLAALLGKHGNRVDIMKQKPKFIRQLSSGSSSLDDRSKKQFLIIGPGCVLYNWLDELETWGYFLARKFHGSDKKQCLVDVKKGKVEIVVTTFETFREHQESLNSVEWDAVIADEVHRIKGLKAQTTHALRGIKCQRRFGLTGTAMQNNMLELWSLCDWVQPRCLGLLVDFEDEYVWPIERGQRHDASKRELAEARKKKEKFAALRRGLMLRRTKKLIADQLPEKDDNVVFAKLSQLQTNIYKAIMSHPSMHYVLHMDDPCECDSGAPRGKCCYRKTPTGETVRSLMFTFMHLLLKVANHVALLIPHAKTSDKQKRASIEICQMALKDHPSFVQQTREAAFKTLSNPKFCGKMKILQGLLGVFQKDHSKVLVFSYSTQVLDIIEHYLMSTGYEYRRIDGSVSCKRRMDIVREFNKDPSIFICLISTKAGGLGLNLTGANRVVIFDPNWNPSHDLQAQDRAYRIGQRRNVKVYRLVSAGTIEENMYLRQIYKQQLLNVAVEDENAKRYFYAVQGDNSMKGELFGVKNMFTIRTGQSCLTMDILKRNEKIESGLRVFDITEYNPQPMAKNKGNDDDDDDDDNGDCKVKEDASEESDNTFEEPNDILMDFFLSQEKEDEYHFPRYSPDTEDPPDSSDEDKDDNKDSKENSRSLDSPPIFANNIVQDSTGYSTVKDKKQPLTFVSTSNKGKALVKGKTCIKSTMKKDEEELASLRRRTKQSKSKTTVPKEDVFINSSCKKKSVRIAASDVPQSRKKYSDDSPPVYDQTLAGDFTSVEAVFNDCGVLHIHENVKVVGGSRAEDHMTKCAITDVYELHQNSQDLAVHCDPLSESSDTEEEVEKPTPVRKGRRSKHNEPDPNAPRSTVVGNTKVLIGQTPKAIRLKQFQQLATHVGAESLDSLAEQVLCANKQGRADMLNQFYGSQDGSLSSILSVVEETDHQKKNDNARVDSRGRGRPSKIQRTKVQGRKRRGKTGRKGLIYDEMSDSESLTQESAKNPKVALDDSVDSDLEVGKTPSPTRKRLRRPVTGYRPSCSLRMQDEHVGQSYQEPPKKTRTSSSRHLNKDGGGDKNDLQGKSYSVAVGDDDAISGDEPSLPFQQYQSQDWVVEHSGQNVDSQELLKEMGATSATIDDGSGSDLRSESDIENKCLNGAPVGGNRTPYMNKKSNTSVLDDIFSDSSLSKRSKRPAPGRKLDPRSNKCDVMSPSRVSSATTGKKYKEQRSEKRTQTNDEKCTYETPNNTSPQKKANPQERHFRELDEIFGDSTETADSDDGDMSGLMNLSTLKDDSVDCFEEPSHRTRRKRKARKVLAVDKLIADSESEYNRLFASGKLKKMDRIERSRGESSRDQNKLCPKKDEKEMLDVELDEKSLSFF